jgi:hypothetical protein
MKNTNYKIFSVLLFSVIFFSCDKENEGLNDSVKVVNSGSAKVVPVSPFLVTNAVNTFNEGGTDKELDFTVVLDVPQPTETFVTVKAISGGTATEDDDFTYDKVVQIAPFAKSGKGKITIVGDAITEGNETFTLKIGDKNDANIVVDQILSFKITDFGNLDLTFAWDMEIPGFAPVTLCQLGYDVDMYIYNAANIDVTAFSGATSDCPETITLNIANLQDGIYQIRANFYADGGLAGAGIAPAFNIPIKMTYARTNSPFSGTIVQDNVNVINSDFGNTPGYDTQFKYVATLKVENGLFTFSKNGTNIATGRVSNAFSFNPSKPRK